MRVSYDKLSRFFSRVIVVHEDRRQGITENGGGLLEGHSMFSAIRSGLVRIPFKLKWHFTLLVG